jgi:hypothetical protein
LRECDQAGKSVLQQAGEFLADSDFRGRADAGYARGDPGNPQDPNTTSSFLNLRVADIWKCYKDRSAKGAVFLTEPLDNHGWEWRCYVRDPNGYLIEVGQYTQLALDRFNKYSAEL